MKRALQSAAEGLARRQLKLVLGGLAMEALVGVGALQLLTGSFSWWMPLGLTVGTLVTFCLSQLSVSLSLHTASAASRLVSSGDSALVLGLRSASAITLVSGAIATLMGAGALVGVRLGATAASLTFLEGCIIGGLGTGLMLHMTGTSLRLSGLTSRATAPGASKHPFYCIHSSNPSLVLDLVAQHTGGAQAHALRVVWAMALQQVLVLVSASTNPGLIDALLGTLLLTQSVSLVCAGAIQLALRANDGVRTWATVLSHGLLANGVMTLVALAGSSYWLLGEHAKLESLLCAVLGAALTWVVVTNSSRGSARQNRRLEDPQDNQRRPALDLGFALPNALQSTATQLVAACVALLALAYLVGETTPATIGLLWLGVGAFAALPYVEAQGLLEPLTEATASLAALRLDQGRAEPHAQLSSLCAVGQQVGAGSQRWFSVSSSLLALLGLACLAERSQVTPSLLNQGVQGLAAVAIMTGVLGVIARRAATTALTGVNEVARHQRAEPDAAKPGYAHYVEVVMGHALDRALWVGTSLVLAVWIAVTAIAKIPSGAGAGQATPPTTFLAFAATAGISVSLLGVGIASFVGVARGFRRVAAESASTPMSDSLNTAQLGLAELAGSSLAPAALVLVHLTIAVVLAVTPFVQ